MILPSYDSTSRPSNRLNSSAFNSLPSICYIVYPLLRLLRLIQLTSFAEALLVIDEIYFLRNDAVKFDFKKGLVKNSAAGGREKLNHLRILARINGHRLGFLESRIHQQRFSFQLNPFNPAPILVILLDRDCNSRVDSEILTMARLRRREKIELPFFTGIKHRGCPRHLVGASRQRHGVMILEVVDNLLL